MIHRNSFNSLMALCDELQISLGIFLVSFSRKCYRVEEVKLSKWFELIQIFRRNKATTEAKTKKSNMITGDNFSLPSQVHNVFLIYGDRTILFLPFTLQTTTHLYVIMFGRHVCHMRVFSYNAFRLLINGKRKADVSA